MHQHYYHPEMNPVQRSFDVEVREAEISQVEEVKDLLRAARDKANTYSDNCEFGDTGQALSVLVIRIDDLLLDKELALKDDVELEGEYRCQ